MEHNVAYEKFACRRKLCKLAGSFAAGIYEAARRRDMLKHGILGLLNYRELTGYEIMIVFRDSLRFFWNAQTSQNYRKLQTLEGKGWVENIRYFEGLKEY